YYRLAVIEVQVPPLRERREDIETLVAQFLRRAAEEEKKPVPAVDPEAMEALRRFDFPGNVRELENVVTRAVIFCDGALLRLEDLPPAMRAGEPRRADTAPASGDGGATPTPQRLLSFADAEAIPPLADIELAAMRRAVELCGGNMALAARRLHIGRATLYRRIHHVETGNG
ncbi:MAG: sigma-54-dependent Fis family transcriptional regulator, partial [Planctomycetes bacterium]|nr:sigma-54-dependent Fis family transcriptional regulator [Planctomycetota bacterium]